MLIMGEPHSSLRAAPATADLQEPVQASLSLAHDFIAQGNTTAALQVVFEALRTVCGKTAAQNAAARVESHLLHLHLQPQQVSSQSAADQLADILTGCRIADNQQASAFASQDSGRHDNLLNTHMQQLQIQGQHRQRSQDQQPLLMELRGMNLAEAGVTDESNFVCNQCGGIVSKSRQAAHQQFWCQANRHY
ncbi:TPA: hypothetical protein ACH3X3_013353 [Trebouxia sp. C0006]